MQRSDTALPTDASVWAAFMIFFLRLRKPDENKTSSAKKIKVMNGDDMAQWLWWYIREIAGRYIREANLIDPVSRTDVRVKYALLQPEEAHCDMRREMERVKRWSERELGEDKVSAGAKWDRQWSQWRYRPQSNSQDTSPLLQQTYQAREKQVIIFYIYSTYIVLKNNTHIYIYINIYIYWYCIEVCENAPSAYSRFFWLSTEQGHRT